MTVVAERAGPVLAKRRRWGRPTAAAAVLGLLVVVRVIAPDRVGLGSRTQDFLTLAISVVVESLPFVVVGIAVSALVQIWLPSEVIFRVLPRTPALRRAGLSLLGVLLPVCECGNVPLARGLLVRGLTVPDVLTFLLAAPILNPITIVVTYQAFGFSDGILVWRVVGGFAIANLVGWLFSRHPHPEDLLTRRFTDSCRTHRHGAESGRPRQTLELFLAETTTMLPALFVGAAAAGAIQVFVPRNLLLVLGQSPLWSVVALIVLAFVIAICSTVDAFFILSLGSTFTPGAIVAFLLFGPMIDVKMLALLRTTFRGLTLVELTAVVALLVAAAGLAVNLAL
ncbi:permease [uncultured Friedmanniella sp.]|uniref:permease n=1 Tax=uncultured Friedmanniella sp. TaxID=335381 RepID=UPI0035CC49EC